MFPPRSDPVVDRQTVHRGFFGRPTQRTEHSTPIGAGWPAWSPDGRSIALAADWGVANGHFQVYVVPVNGGLQSEMTSGYWSALYPAWSPDGTEIAYYFDQNDLPSPQDNWGVAIMAAVPGAQSTTAVNSGHDQLGGFVWSPDGTRLAYTIFTGGPGKLHRPRSPRISASPFSPEGRRGLSPPVRTTTFRIGLGSRLELRSAPTGAETTRSGPSERTVRA